MGTVNSVITRVQDRYPDLDSTRALVLFKEAHRELVDRMQLRNKTVTFSSFVAGTREYVWDETDIKVRAALYFPDSSSQGLVLTPMSTDELDISFEGWRGETSRSTPDYFYFDTATDTNTAQMMLGFHLIPDTTTSALYPQAKFYCTSYADMTGTDTTPPHLLSDQVYFDRMCYLWCKDFHWADVPYWDAISEREIERNIQHIQNMTRKKSRIHRPHMVARPLR